MKIACWIFTGIAAFNILGRLGLLYQDLAYLYGEAAITVWMAAVLGIIILVRQSNDRKGVAPPPVQPIKWGPSKKADVPDPEWLPPKALTGYQPGRTKNPLYRTKNKTVSARQAQRKQNVFAALVVIAIAVMVLACFMVALAP